MEEYRCFGILPQEETTKLTELFYDVDYNGEGFIDEEKGTHFNKFVDKRCDNSKAQRDASDFIVSCGIIDGEKVSLEEWLFSWAKLFVADKRVFEKFFRDYDQAVQEKAMGYKDYAAQEGLADYDR